ncbi:U11/U12 small nuclear ribonucleoprotein 48 kDa protein [Punica granatum]|uniref:U11/U12 small nuclear ribonucleoprotein 48 kDa protein n=1 Tax=Punica granatum TaxID=22663 RepID=A0A218W3B8_PUNGR|nr:U11/U12 small nuclear ribonucleoprotein 48 kDa protein [Punica granatum]OWM67354.1 hypothetical protein CDL15_Pgr000806 [Punica granatum]
MNPSPSPYPNQPFSFFPAIPNPNPSPIFNLDPNSYRPLPQNPHPQNSAAAAPDLSATLSNLKSLITLSEQTFTSLAAVLPPKPHNDGHVPCPFNPHHRMPPESLFSHHLHCPTSLDLGRAIDSLNYPKTLKSSDELAKENRFVQRLSDPNAELCFTLDDYTDFRESLNSFYEYCPGVVSFPSEDSSTKRAFTLLGSLSVECANFITDRNGEVEAVDESRVRLLLSEYWWVQNEVGAWNDYPSTCTYHVVCAILGLGMVRENDLRRWVIIDSPRFGIVIDEPMRDHVTVLLTLCLKAIAKEARTLVKSRSSTKFNCPILVQVMMWLASQLSVLYGEVGGKFFAIDLFKLCILDAASHMLLRPLELEVSSGENGSSQEKILDASASDARDGDIEEPIQKKESRRDSLMSEGLNTRVIFVSQVAAAVAALHERSVLEQKIRALRHSQQLHRYQRVMELNDVSKRAEDERRKRSDYRPIIDHDGLPRHQPSMQDSGKTKTREELLAEERDYKRRRTSYRGKKAKRNPSEVLRDIIEEYMEEIKQAGGIGCFEKATADGILLHGPASSSDLERKNINELSSATRVDSSPSHAYIEHRSGSNPFDDTYLKYEQRRRYPERPDSQTRGKGRERLDKDYYSRSPERSSYGRSSDYNSYRKERNSMDLHKSEHHDFKRSSSDRSYYREYKSSSRNYTEEEDWKSRSRDRKRRNMNDRYSSDFENAFEDRYDPSKSSDLYEDEAA